MLQSADSVRITDRKKEQAIQIFTDGGKSEHGVGVGIAIFIQSKLAYQIWFTLYNRCSNNQDEALAIAKALEATEISAINENFARRVTVHTESRISLNSLKKPKITVSSWKKLGKKQ